MNIKIDTHAEEISLTMGDGQGASWHKLAGEHSQGFWYICYGAYGRGDCEQCERGGKYAKVKILRMPCVR